MKKIMLILSLLGSVTAFADNRLSTMTNSDIKIQVVDPVGAPRHGPNLKSCYVEGYDYRSFERGSWATGVYKVSGFSFQPDQIVSSRTNVHITVLDDAGNGAFRIGCMYNEDSLDDLNVLLGEIGLRAVETAPEAPADSPDGRLVALRDEDIKLRMIDPVGAPRHGPNLKSCQVSAQNLHSFEQGAYAPGLYKVSEFRFEHDQDVSNRYNVHFNMLNQAGTPALRIYCMYNEDSIADLNVLLGEIGLKAVVPTHH
jgi:hypothetical protein